MNKFILTTLFVSSICLAQINQKAEDTISETKQKTVTIDGYVDIYYGGTFSKTDDNNIPYFVSMNRNNEANINLAYIDFKYQTENLRSRFVLGFGTYMNANYANETGTLKNIVEASIGTRLSKSKDIWLDAGVIGSPYTNENAISKDHLMYTRSLAPEYVPYYLTGVKLSMPLTKKINAYLYLINGWQQIKDNNSGKSFGTQIEYKPNDNNLFNWNTYIGDERSEFSPDYRMRYFTDVFWTYNKGKFLATSCAYIGNQKKTNVNGNYSNNIWWQVNFIGRQSLSEKLSISGRLEYFNDENNIQITPLNQVSGFKTFSSGLCLNLKINENAMFRIEGRQFLSNSQIYVDQANNPSKNMTWLITNLTFWL